MIFLDSENDIFKSDFSKYESDNFKSDLPESKQENNSLRSKIISIDDSDEPHIIINDAEKFDDGVSKSLILNKEKETLPIDIDGSEKDNNEVYVSKENDLNLNQVDPTNLSSSQNQQIINDEIKITNSIESQVENKDNRDQDVNNLKISSQVNDIVGNEISDKIQNMSDQLESIKNTCELVGLDPEAKEKINHIVEQHNLVSEHLNVVKTLINDELNSMNEQEKPNELTINTANNENIGDQVDNQATCVINQNCSENNDMNDKNEM